MAEQVAAGIEVAKAANPEPSGRLGLHYDHVPLRGPDDLAAALVLLGSGYDFELPGGAEPGPTRVRTVRVETRPGQEVENRPGQENGAGEPGPISLPACRGELDPQVASRGAFAAAASSAVSTAVSAGPDRLASSVATEIGELAEALDRALPADLGISDERLASRWTSHRRGRERPVLFASPGLDPRRFVALARWSLWRSSAWTLEPQADAFVATALWARPSVLVATTSDLAALAPAFDAAARRQSRLRAVVRVGGEAVPGPWDGLGIAMLEW